MKLETGDPAPDFSLPTDTKGEVKLSDLRGQNVVVYFYPKDMTSGCTREAIEFSEHSEAFRAANTLIIGISADSVKRHASFREKHQLSIVLASDEERKAIEAYGVWVEKNMYGRKYMGIERSSFLVDDKGKIVKIWRKVRLKGHVEDVLAAAQDLNH
ncbi:MAG TPA: thioredoxin-dependent thiol peroxidase [Rhizobiales bacterium]|nr:thioredoxin-dependent thiol peroxidase [Hyphomicrobiales bacterium]